MPRVKTTMVFNNFGKISDVVRTELGRAVEASTALVEAGAKLKIMNGPKTGRIYDLGNGIEHQASAPDEAPATDTGTLVNSIGHTIKSQLTGEVNVGAEYATVLEFGGVKMEARPFLQPSINDESTHFFEMCADALERGSQQP